jgi:hypothetical protein
MDQGNTGSPEEQIAQAQQEMAQASAALRAKVRDHLHAAYDGLMQLQQARPRDREASWRDRAIARNIAEYLGMDPFRSPSSR